MNTKHTPGPWTIDKEGDIVGQNGYVIPLYGIHSPPSHYKVMKQEADANQKLVAAAPELLEALQQAKMGLEVHWEYARGREDYIMFTATVFTLEKIDAAIAKATGQK